jgi:uncharacterized protein YjdB
MRWSWRRMPLVPAVLLGSACGVTDTDEPKPVASIAVTPKTLQVAAGGTAALEATVTDDAGNVIRGRRVVWASSNPSIATVSANGVVTGVSAGRADIAVTAEGKSDVSSVTVTPLPARVASVRIAPDNVELVVAAGTTLIATPLDSRGVAIGGRTIVWMTNNATVAAISQSGRVTALVPGTAVITAVIDGVAGNATVVVRLVPVASVVVTPANPTIGEGKSTTLSARLTDAAGNILTGRTITWTSADPRIVTVDQFGVVRGVRKGSVVITATSEGKLGTTTVKVQ